MYYIMRYVLHVKLILTMKERSDQDEHTKVQRACMYT